MVVHRKSENVGCKSKCDEYIVGEGDYDTTHQDIRLFLAGCTHPQSNHLCPCSKRDDGCSNGSLTEPNDLGEPKSTFHDGWTSHCHCRQTTKGQQDRFPMQMRARGPLLVAIIVIIVIVVRFRLRHALHRLSICPK